MKFVKNLKSLKSEDFSFAGAKATNLGRLLKIGMPVPEGFVILTSAFERFLEKNDINVEISTIWRKINLKDIESVEEASEIIRDLILKAKIPKDLEKEIFQASRALRAKYFAVRSSATTEDSKIDSFAGQFETYLNVRKEDLISAVKKCWASLYLPRVLFYRKKRKILRKKISIGVILQKMIDAEISGVCFTSHPITQDKNQILIEAIWGLGELLVQGKVTPDSYVVEREKNSKFKILDVNVALQKKMLVRKKDETKEVLVPKTKQKAQKLSKNQIKKLTKLCLKIENYFKFPQDIEWGIFKGKFYIFQTRPITTFREIY